MPDDSTYTLLVAFTDQTASFVHGFEAGQLWARLERKPLREEMLLHAANHVVVHRIAHYHGYTLHLRELSDEWLEVTCVRKET